MCDFIYKLLDAKIKIKLSEFRDEGDEITTITAFRVIGQLKIFIALQEIVSLAPDSLREKESGNFSLLSMLVSEC